MFNLRLALTTLFEAGQLISTNGVLLSDRRRLGPQAPAACVTMPIAPAKAGIHRFSSEQGLLDPHLLGKDGCLGRVMIPARFRLT